MGHEHGQACNSTKNELTDIKICDRVSPCGTKTFYLPRSQGSNTARRIVGWLNQNWAKDATHGFTTMTTEYTNSFDSDRISQYLFGSTCLKFSGSQVIDRDPERDLVADYFGLPTTFEGIICFKPKIENVIIDFVHHLNLEPWCSGAFAEIHFPFCVTFWDLGLNCSEQNNNGPVQPVFPACYMSENPSKTLSSIQQALTGQSTFGNMTSPFDFGVFPFSKLYKTGIADIDILAGWRPILGDDYHLSGFLQATIPGGNRPNGKIIFEPIVGNGKNWELGGGVDGHAELFCTENQSFGIYLHAIAMHRFKTFQTRSIDLREQGFMSRYLLLKEFNTKNNTISSLINAIDVTTRAVRVGQLTRFDGSIKASYTICDFKFDLGYNLYVKTAEKLEIMPNLYPTTLHNKTFGIKGTEGVCFRKFDTNTGQVITGTNCCCNIDCSKLDCSICKKTCCLNSTANNSTITDPGTIDNPEEISGLPAGQVPITWDSSTNPEDLEIAQKSDPPVFLSIEDLNPCSAAVPQQVTNKIFIHASYMNIDSCWTPQIGIGGEAEFDANPKYLAALNQWGIWIKGGITF